MAIIHKFDQSGGFAAGDTDTGLTSFAYPSSTHATDAKRNADKVAAEMMANEKPLDFFPVYLREGFAAQHARMLAWLQA